MVKILHILTKKLSTDGITSCLLNYYKYINKDKFTMDVVAPDVIDMIKSKIEQYNGKIYILKNREKNVFKYIKNLALLIKKNQYDIVHIHGSSSILCIELIASKIAGCKIRIVHSHNTKSDHEKIDKLLRPIFYHYATYNIACGEDAGKFLFENNKFDILNNGKDLNEFKYNKEIRIQMRKDYNLDNKIVIGHIGSFNYQKNHDFLIDVFYELSKKNYNKYNLILIGEGRFRKEIEEKAKKLNMYENIIFVGRTDEVAKWLQAFDIVVFPSRYEGFPVVLVEWQIAGIPCIISDKITSKVKLTDLVEFMDIENSAKEWAEKIEKYNFEDREKNNSIILEKIKQKGFDIKEVVNKLEQIYITLMEENIN